MRKRIRLTESDLHRIIKESVYRILRESGDTKRGQFLIGRLANRKGEDIENGEIAQHIKKQHKGEFPYNHAFEDGYLMQADNTNEDEMQDAYDFYKNYDVIEKYNPNLRESYYGDEDFDESDNYGRPDDISYDDYDEDFDESDNYGRPDLYDDYD